MDYQIKYVLNVYSENRNITLPADNPEKPIRLSTIHRGPIVQQYRTTIDMNYSSTVVMVPESVAPGLEFDHGRGSL
ncbi:hypothetical protein BN903_30 [Halorubrum sp. AJ67]|nr:hypothetical protein BN903_30 [Halorubrum sp. AJ67]